MALITSVELIGSEWQRGISSMRSRRDRDTHSDLPMQMLQAFTFDRMILHDVAITNDQQRMLCVATLTASPDGLKPSMSREEKQIIGTSIFSLLMTNDRKQLYRILSVQSGQDRD